MSIVITEEIRKFYQRICAELESFPDGTRFFSVRGLMKRYSVSRRVVDETLIRLRREGRIRIEERNGIFVRKQGAACSKQILEVRVDWPSAPSDAQSAALSGELERRGYRLTRFAFSPSAGLSFLEELERRKADAVILMSGFVKTTEELIRLLSLSCPKIFLFDNYCGNGFDMVDTLPEYTGMLAADYLIRCGHRRTAVLFSEPASPGKQRQVNGFLGRFQLLGITPEVLDCKVNEGTSSLGRTEEFLSAYIRKHGVSFTGLFCLSDFSALGAVNALRENGIQVPADVSVIGYLNSADAERCDPPLTTVSHDCAEVARAVADGLDALFSGGEFGCRIVKPRLFERKSVCNRNR